jgi:hypothetical protein
MTKVKKSKNKKNLDFDAHKFYNLLFRRFLQLQCFTLLKVYIPTAPLEAAENMPDTECLPMPATWYAMKST